MREKKTVYKVKEQKIWEAINKLTDKTTPKKTLQIYDRDGHQLTDHDACKEVSKFWRTVYNKHENTIDVTWNNENIKSMRPN